MLIERDPSTEQLPLKGIDVQSPKEAAINILGEEYLRNNGDLRPFFAELAQRRTKPRDNRELWSMAGGILTKVQN